MAVNNAFLEQITGQSGSTAGSVPDIYTFTSAGKKIATAGYAVDQVLERPKSSSLVTLPCTQEWLLGVMKYKGYPVPVVDLAFYSGLTKQPSEGKNILIHSATDGGYIGFVIDSDIEFFNSDNLTMSDKAIEVPGIMNQCILAILNIDLEKVPLLCLDRLVKSNQFNFLQNA